MSTLGERIRRVRCDILRLNQAEFAKALGFSRVATISDYEKDKRSPDVATLRDISFKGRVSLQWLLAGSEGKAMDDEEERPAMAPDASRPLPREGFAEVKVYDMTDVRGAGEFPGTAEAGSILVPAADSLKCTVAMRVRGASMSPSVLDGAVAGVDGRDRRIVSKGLYAVWLDYEGVTIRRAFAHTDHIALRPDNPMFPETRIPLSGAGEGSILGRVVWLYQAI
jgi:phage repressor protein C with HTH and peptisase S24 domain/DNA-binding XRE family transcriptional regulator